MKQAPKIMSQLRTKAGRPLRQAAKRAHGIHALRTLPPKKDRTPTHGWIEEDQILEPEIFFHFNEDDSSDDPDSSLNSTLVNTSFDDAPSHFDEELTWDSSPEQFQLSFSDTHDDSTPTISSQPGLLQKATSIPTPHRLHVPPRRFAISEQDLYRSNAFRHPPDADRIPPPFPRNQPANDTPNRTRPSRIPKPTSPSQMDMSAVNDISAMDIPSFVHEPTARRTVPRINYQVFHNTGRKTENKKN